jgi:serine/threonine-protein kinase
MNDLLAYLTEAVADGRSIDWPKVTRDLDAEDLHLVEQVRIVCEIARLHGTLPSDAEAPPHEQAIASALGRLGTPPTWRTIQFIEPVGRGTYGVVYRAHDSALERDVAVKLLPPLTSPSAEGVDLIEEGRRLARVRHPNVVTVFGADRIEGLVGIWMEFIDGVTLEEAVVDRGPLSAAEARLVGLDVCAALAAVHRAGLLHRDVKAQNVMRERGGRIVLMDFGAGYQYGHDADPGVASLTGTPLYLAPEIMLHGGRPSERSDLYATGVLLYRLVTGEFPSSGRTPEDICRALESGSWRRLLDARTDLPGPFVRVVEQALSHDPEQRFGTAGTFGTALALSMEADPLRELSHPTAESAFDAGRERGSRWTQRGAAAVAGLVVVGLLAGAGVLWSRLDVSTTSDAEVAGLPGVTRPRQLTTGLGVERWATWSPDGRTLAFQSNEGGNEDIWVTQVGGGRPINLTADNDGVDATPAWSPDGTLLAFQSDRGGGGIFMMPALGGEAQMVSAVPPWDAAHPRWSPAGTQVGYIVYAKEDAAFDRAFMEVITLSSGETERFSLPGDRNRRRFDLSWSPDGRFVAYVVAAGRGVSTSQIVVLRLEDAEAFEITDTLTGNWTPAWSPDSRRLLFVSDRGGTRDVWVQRLAEDGVPAGPAEAVTAGVGIQGVAVSPGGSALAYSRGGIVANLWRVPILEDRSATWADAEQLTFDQAVVEFVDVSADGTRLAFSSDRSGNHNLWSLRVSSRELQQLTSDPGHEWDPHWSPDGRSISFYSHRGENRDIWVMATGAAVARRLTRHTARELGSTWSPDGRTIAFWSDREGGGHVWTVPSEGGAPRRLTNHIFPGFWPDWSPDGKWIAFQSRRLTGIWRAPTDGGEPELVADVPGGRVKWAPDQRTIYFLGQGRGAGDIWAASLESGAVRPMTTLAGKRGSLGPVALATDGRALYFTWEERSQDLWVMDFTAPIGE